jgi:hypothetical protein
VSFRIDDDLLAWERGEIADEELARRHPGELDGVLVVHRLVTRLASMPVDDAEASWRAIGERINADAKRSRRGRSVGRLVALAAAAVLLLAGAAFAATGGHPLHSFHVLLHGSAPTSQDLPSASAHPSLGNQGSGTSGIGSSEPPRQAGVPSGSPAPQAGSGASSGDEGDRQGAPPADQGDEQASPAPNGSPDEGSQSGPGTSGGNPGDQQGQPSGDGSDQGGTPTPPAGDTSGAGGSVSDDSGGATG